MVGYIQEPFNIFVFSLSEERSILSQWRSYTPHGKGLSLGFGMKLLNHILGHTYFKIARCVYERNEQHELISSLLDKLLVTFRRERDVIDTTKAHPTQSYFPFLERFRGDLLRILAIVKAEAFREEHEWRLISPYFERYTVPEIKFRQGASILVPYTEIPLAAVEANGMLFESVTLGPSPHVALSMAALSFFLSNQKIASTLTNANIPYREW